MEGSTLSVTGQYKLRHRSLLPDAPGIYFVTDECDILLYLGKATSLRRRWAGAAHHRYKQFARKGLDKITIGYVLVSLSELDETERQYILKLKPLLNNGRVKQFLPKKSPRLSELQRLLKLASSPLFPSCKFTSDKDGNTILRPPWDAFRGIVAGTYVAGDRTRIVIVCQQNMGQIIGNSYSHRTKRRFYLDRADWESQPAWQFDAREVVFEFVEFFCYGDRLFEQLYPYLEECQIAGVKLRKLNNTACIKSVVATLPADLDNLERDYLYAISDSASTALTDRLEVIPGYFHLNEEVIW